MDQSAKLVSLATSVPPHVLNQSDVASAASRGFAGRYDDFDRMALTNSGALENSRHTVEIVIASGETATRGRRDVGLIQDVRGNRGSQ